MITIKIVIMISSDLIKNARVGDRAVVCRLFRKPVNLLQKTVGYRLTFIQSSDLYFL